MVVIRLGARFCVGLWYCEDTNRPKHPLCHGPKQNRSQKSPASFGFYKSICAIGKRACWMGKVAMYHGPLSGSLAFAFSLCCVYKAPLTLSGLPQN